MAIERERTRVALVRPDRLLAAVTRIETSSQDFNPRAYTLEDLDTWTHFGFFHYFMRHEPFGVTGMCEHWFQFSNDRRQMNVRMQGRLIELLHHLVPGCGVRVNKCGKGITTVSLNLDRKASGLPELLLVYRVIRQVHVDDLRNPQWTVPSTRPRRQALRRLGARSTTAKPSPASSAVTAAASP